MLSSNCSGKGPDLTQISSIRPFHAQDHSSQKKKWKHHPHQSNRNRIVPRSPRSRFTPKGEKKEQRDKRHAAYCTEVSYPGGTHNLRNGSPIGKPPNLDSPLLSNPVSFPPFPPEQRSEADSRMEEARERSGLLRF